MQKVNKVLSYELNNITLYNNHYYLIITRTDYKLCKKDDNGTIIINDNKYNVIKTGSMTPETWNKQVFKYVSQYNINTNLVI